MPFGAAAAARLVGKTILITGASSGIGKATALEFVESAEGKIKLLLTARRTERLTSIKSELEEKFPEVKVHPQFLDVSKTNSIPQFFKNIPQEYKDIDVLVNNAGLALGSEHVGEIDQEEINTVFSTNVLGNIALVQALLPHFKKKNAGDIVQVGSIAGREPYPGGSIYCASKSALNAFTHSLRKELISTKIRVIEVQPGAVETEFSIVRHRGDTDRAKAAYVAEPLYAEDIADNIVYAVSRRQNMVVAESLLFPSNQAGGGGMRWEDPNWK